MKSGLEDILKYVMDMLKQRVEDQIDALEDMKDAYSEIVAQKKESLEASKDEADSEKERAKKLREMAKLQAQIDVLSLDNSREAQAEKAKLLEEMAELQDELAENQADKSLEATEKALDEMETAYHEAKDKEITDLEDSIFSYQKLYDWSIDYITDKWGTDWDSLLKELTTWNYKYGSELQSTLETAWNNAYKAAERYGDYVSALNNIDADIESSQSSGQNLTVGKTNYDSSYTNEELAHAIVRDMQANSAKWWNVKDDASALTQLEADQQNLAAQLRNALPGMTIERKNGVWYINGEELYKSKYAIYHKGGFAGETGSLKDNEILAKLEKGETVLTTGMWGNFTAMLDRISQYSASLGDLPLSLSVRQAALDDTLKRVSGGMVTNVSNSSQPVEIHMGDITINAPSGDGKIIADEVRKITYDNADQIARYLRLRL